MKDLQKIEKLLSGLDLESLSFDHEIAAEGREALFRIAEKATSLAARISLEPCHRRDQGSLQHTAAVEARETANRLAALGAIKALMRPRHH